MAPTSRRCPGSDSVRPTDRSAARSAAAKKKWVGTTPPTAHSRTLTSGKLDSTPHARCPASPPRRSGESLPGAERLQSVSGNSRVLDTLDTKLRVEAYYQSGSLSPAVEQLESGAWNSQLLRLDVQLEAVPGSSVTTWSIPGVCCTSPHSPVIPSRAKPGPPSSRSAKRQSDQHSPGLLSRPLARSGRVKSVALTL